MSLLAMSALATGSCFAADQTDHPLIQRYPNATIRVHWVQDYEPFTLPVSSVDMSSGKPAYKSVATLGNLSRHFYNIKNISTLKVFENYQEAAKKLGFTVTFQCKLDACGNDRQAQALGALVSAQGDVYNWYRNPYYLVAEKQVAKGKIYAAWFVGAYESEVAVQQVISETVPLDNALIKVDSAYLTKAPAAPVETANAAELAKDHKLLARYPGASLRNATQADTETFTIPAAPNASGQAPLNLTGDLARHFYVINNVSTLKVFENYKQAIAKAGFNILSKCELAECGNDRAVQTFGGKISVENSVYNWYRNPYYFVAKKAGDSNTYVAIFVGAYEASVAVQQVVMQTKAVETGLVKINAGALKQQIDSDGRAAIYGIYFDTGKAVVKPESKQTLDVIAQLLTENKELNLYVVGHTDDTGSGAVNLELSRQRAAAVVDALVKSYQIPTARLQAQGVGPYAPAGNNTSDAGKQKNRRVELVKRIGG
jgi:outer membrane protein OmpA-like peptidoglycan-associated protein